jgi:hypothetical protein
VIHAHVQNSGWCGFDFVVVGDALLWSEEELRSEIPIVTCGFLFVAQLVLRSRTFVIADG